jgi:hypothetical protein
VEERYEEEAEVEEELDKDNEAREEERDVEKSTSGGEEETQTSETEMEKKKNEKTAPKDFLKGPWVNPSNTQYGKGRRHAGLIAETAAVAHGKSELEDTETAYVVLAEDEPENYKEAMKSKDAAEWKKSCQDEFETLIGYRTWDLVEKPEGVNLVGSRWTFRVKRDNKGNVDKFKARVVAQGYSQIPGVDFQETYSPTIRFTSIRLILALACKYEIWNYDTLMSKELISMDNLKTTYICVNRRGLFNQGKKIWCVNSTKECTD